MALTSISLTFFFIVFLFSFGFVQNVPRQNTKKQDQSNSASWQGKSAFKESWPLHSENNPEKYLYRATVKENDASKNFGQSEFDEMVLERHNLYRKKHRVPALVHSQRISAISQEWANKLAERDEFKHSSNAGYGENLYYVWNYELSPNDVVDSWYNEIEHYTYLKGPNRGVVGHFTQLVWKNTKELGIGVAKSKTNVYYVVCNYSPIGNVFGQYAENVLPPLHFQHFSIHIPTEITKGEGQMGRYIY